MLARAARLVALLALAVIPAGCEEAVDRAVVTVFAASSLTEAFEALERGYEAANPDVDVKLAFAGSQVLRLQIEQGAPADVFASAHPGHMEALVDAGRILGSRTFASNELVVIVPERNPAGIEAFEDLSRATRIVIGTDGVPVGIYTRRVLERARVALGERFVTEVRRAVASEESNVRLVRAKVELGEADAAVVYRTDTASSDRVRVVPIPEALNVRARYPIGRVAGSDHAAEAARFVDYVTSLEGRRVLRRHGFFAEAP